MKNLLLTVKTVDWKKNITNFLIFAGADTITALVAIQTQLIPFIHNPAGAIAAVIFVNYIIDLLRKFQTAHRELNG